VKKFDGEIYVADMIEDADMDDGGLVQRSVNDAQAIIQGFLGELDAVGGMRNTWQAKEYQYNGEQPSCKVRSAGFVHAEVLRFVS
jgi:hypothetical protein